MKTSLLTFIAFSIALNLSAQQNPQPIEIPDSKTVDEWLASQKVPAIAIGTIENGKLDQTLVRGKNHENIAVKSNAIFDVASLTKTITTLLSLKLISNGSLELDEPLCKYWIDPDIKNQEFYKLLTTRHVLSHRTGFANWRWMNEDGKLGFDFEPGSKFQYSGEGFEYLRKALESKFNTTFEQLTDSLVFKPNNMNNSHLVWNNDMDSTSFTGTHDKLGNPYDYEKSFHANAADNLLTTIEDFSRMGEKIINQEYLDQEIYNEMISAQSVVREGINFGLGWIVFNDLPNDEYALFNAGSDTGVNALIVLLPKSKRGLIVMTNGDNGRALAMQAIGKILGESGHEILSRF